jgi:hypothetical protein
MTGEIREKTTNYLTTMTSYFNFCLILLIYALTSSRLPALDLIVPPREEMLIEANLVVIGHFLKKDPSIFIIDEYLKSSRLKTKMLTIKSPFPQSSYSLNRITEFIGESQTIFIGRLDQDGVTASPDYGDNSFWPQGLGLRLNAGENLVSLKAYIVKQIRSD